MLEMVAVGAMATQLLLRMPSRRSSGAGHPSPDAALVSTQHSRRVPRQQLERVQRQDAPVPQRALEGGVAAALAASSVEAQ